MTRSPRASLTRPAVLATAVLLATSPLLARPQPATTRPASDPAAARATDATSAPTPLADRVPAGAIFYAAWAGRNNLPPEFAQTPFFQILTSLELDRWSRDELPTLLPPNFRTQPFADPLLELGRVVVTYAWDNTAAIYTTGMGVSDDLTPAPHICFLIQFPDARAAEAADRDLLSRLDAITQGNPLPNVRLYREGALLAMTVNDTMDKSPLAKLARPLASEPRYQLAARKTAAPTDAAASPTAPPTAALSAVTLYYDLEKIWALSDEARNQEPEYERNMALSGLRHAKALMVSAGYIGNDYASRTFVELTPERAGVLGFLTSPTRVDDRLYAGVPRSAVSMTSLSLDLADLFARVKREGEQIRQGFAEQADAYTGLIGGMLGVNVAEFTANFGPEVALYALPGADISSFDFILLTRPRDAARADEQLLGLARGASRMLLTQRRDLPRLTVDRREEAGSLVTTARLPRPGSPTATAEAAARAVTTTQPAPALAVVEADLLVSPSWAVRNGYLMIAHKRSVLTRALAELDKGVLTEAEPFTRLRGKLQAPVGASFGYADLPRTLPGQYANWQFLARLAGNRINPRLAQLPLPTMDQLNAETSPSASATWVDDDGLNFRSLSPYPAAELFSATWSLVAGPRSLPLVLPRFQSSLGRP